MRRIDYNTLIERLTKLDPITFESIRSMVLESDKVYMQFLNEHHKRFADQLTDSQIDAIFAGESEHLKQYNTLIDNIIKVLSDKQILTGTEDENKLEMRTYVYSNLLTIMQEKIINY